MGYPQFRWQETFKINALFSVKRSIIVFSIISILNRLHSVVLFFLCFSFLILRYKKLIDDHFY